MNPMAKNKHTHTSKRLERSDEKETRISKWRVCGDITILNMVVRVGLVGKVEFD